MTALFAGSICGDQHPRGIECSRSGQPDLRSEHSRLGPRFRRCYKPFEPSRIRFGIIVQRRDIRGFRSMDHLIHRRAETYVPPVRDDTHARTARLHTIRSAVVHDYHFKSPERLRFQSA